MTNPIVSIIMITYNRERYLRESIASVLSQTFDKIELIIVDDGSSDNSELLITQFNDHRIHYYKSEHTGKASGLRNLGIETSQGQYLAFIDSDDIWMPEKLELQMRALKDHPQSGFTFSNVVEFINDGSILKQGIYTLWKESFEANLFDTYVQNKFSIYPSTFLFKKECMEKTGKLSELFPWTDNDFFHRLAFHFKGFVIISPLVKIRKHDENTSSSLGQETVKEMLHMLNAFFKEGMITKSVFIEMTGHYYYLSGMLFLRSGNNPSARKALINCLRYNPAKIKAWIRVFLSMLNIPQKA